MSQLSQTLSFLFFYAPLLTIIATILGLYFYNKKIGHKISCSYSISSNQGRCAQIPYIIFTNHKDKTEIIYGVYYLTNSCLFPIWESNFLDKGTAPIILKSYESILLKSDEVTSYFKNNKNGLSSGIDILEEEHKSIDRDLMYYAIYVSIPGKMIRCQISVKENPYLFCKRNGYNQVYTQTGNTFHPLSPEKRYTIPKDAIYTISYDYNGSHEIGWIFDNGGVEWQGYISVISDIASTNEEEIIKDLQDGSPYFVSNICVSSLKKYRNKHVKTVKN